MKTEEDEAFEDIERRQGGFQAKRAMAADKLQEPAQEPVAWADLVKEAQQIVKSKFLWKKFIDGTPLANDIACWMADFAQQHTTPPLPAQPAQEPVAWIWKDMRGQDIVSLFEPRFNSIPLYTAPPQREWVGLTDEEIDAWTPEIHVVIRAIEQLLMEKNND